MIVKTTDINLLNTLTDYKITINPFSNIYEYVLNNKIVGFIDYNLIYDCIELNYIYVKEEYRGKKIASLLLEQMIHENKNITLEVNVNNENAISLYKKYGFKIINTRKNYYNGIDGYLMERKSIFNFLNNYDLKEYGINDISIAIKKDYTSLYNYNENEIYDIASLTKLFTLNLLYNLDKEKIINLNDNISKYLNCEINVSILDLIKMQYYIKLNKNLKDCVDYNDFKNILLNGIITENNPSYNDVGFCLLGVLIEEVTNKSLKENFELLFLKYNLYNTKIYPNNYKVLGNGNNLNLPHDLKSQINAITGAAGIFSNVFDIITYCDKIVKYEIFDELFIKEIFKYNFLDSHDRNRTFAGLYKYTGNEYCYVKASKTALAHQGFTGSWICFDFDSKYSYCLLTNCINQDKQIKNENFFIGFHKILNDILRR